MDSSSFLGNLYLNRVYKFLVYLGSLLLILSLFFEVKNFNLHSLRIAAYTLLLAGLLMWFIDELLNKILELYSVKETIHTLDKNQIWTVYATIWWIRLIFYITILGFAFWNIKITLYP